MYMKTNIALFMFKAADKLHGVYAHVHSRVLSHAYTHSMRCLSDMHICAYLNYSSNTIAIRSQWGPIARKPTLTRPRIMCLVWMGVSGSGCSKVHCTKSSRTQSCMKIIGGSEVALISLSFYLSFMMKPCSHLTKVAVGVQVSLALHI